MIESRSVDDHVFALDAATGEIVWETQVLDYRVNPATRGASPILSVRPVLGVGCGPDLRAPCLWSTT